MMRRCDCSWRSEARRGLALALSAVALCGVAEAHAQVALPQASTPAAHLTPEGRPATELTRPTVQLQVLVPVQRPPEQHETLLLRVRGKGADAAAREARDDKWDLRGEARLRTEAMPSFAVDASGTRSGRTLWAMSRVVAGAMWQASPALKVDLELEALNGWAGGDTTALGTTYTDRPFLLERSGSGDLARVLPRKAMLTWTTGVGQVLVGAQAFQWGLGMLAADGSQAPDFGDAWLGNVVARAAFATRPLANSGLPPLWRDLTVFVGADWVIRDDNASLYDGDEAGAGVLGVRAGDDTLKFGLLLAARSQTDREDPWRPDLSRARTRVLATDAWARWHRDVGNVRLGLEGELAYVAGTSTRPWSDETAAKGADVRQLGALARLRLDHDPSFTTFKLEAGYASGDNDIRDAQARQFAMHSDHNVGLVLFDQVLPMMQARSIDRLADPKLVAVRPPSARFAVQSGGQVSNAAYLHPVVRWRPLPPLDVRLGYVLAVAASDVADPYQTALRGGFATTVGGAVQGGRTYGHEIDARVTWDVALPRHVTLRVGGEGGLLVPGSALAGVDGLGTPWMARGLLSLLW